MRYADHGHSGVEQDERDQQKGEAGGVAIEGRRVENPDERDGQQPGSGQQIGPSSPAGPAGAVGDAAHEGIGDGVPDNGQGQR